MKKTFISILALAAAAFAQFPGPPAAYPRMHSDTISDTALMLWQNPSYGGSASTKLKSMTFAQLAQGVGATIDSLAVTCGLGLNCDSTGTGKIVRQKDATLVRPTANWLNQTGKGSAGNQILCVGDSNCKGIVDTTITWLNMMNLFTPFASRINLGVGGLTAGALDSNYAWVDSLFNPLVQNVLVNNVGTNNAPQGTSAVQTYAQIASYNLARRNKGWFVVTQTIPDRCGYNEWRDSLNTLIRNNWPKFANALADLGASPLIGANGTCNDTTYFDGGGLHFNTAGKRVIADITQNSINAFYKQSSIIAPVVYGTGKAKMVAASNTVNGDSTNWDASLIGSYVQFSNGALFEIYNVTNATTMTATTINSGNAPTAFAAYTIIKPVQYLSTNPNASDFGASAQGTFTTDGFLTLKGNFKNVDSSVIPIINNSATGTSNNACISWKGRTGFDSKSPLINVCGGSDGQPTDNDVKGVFKVNVSKDNGNTLVNRVKVLSDGTTYLNGFLNTGDPFAFSATNGLNIYNYYSSLGGANLSYAIRRRTTNPATGAGRTAFYSWGGSVTGATSEFMSVSDSGNVSLGDTVDSDKLRVKGAVNATSYKAGGVPGFTGTCGLTDVVTVVGGIITGCAP